jgi:fatty-acyl-CoA synthase
MKDVIIRGGHNIDAALIEEALLKSPDVLHAAAVGKPDAYAGELPVAYVQLISSSQTTAAELMAFASSHIAERAAIPKDIYIVDEIPLSDVGKPIKVALRRDAAERTFRTVLTDALEASGERAQLRPVVRPHVTKGTELAILVKGASMEDRGRLVARIAQVMGPYSFAYAIEWDE